LQRPDGHAKFTTTQLYLPDTNVLITRFLMPDGVGEVQGFMAPSGTQSPLPYQRSRIPSGLAIALLLASTMQTPAARRPDARPSSGATACEEAFRDARIRSQGGNGTLLRWYAGGSGSR
jgi:hypothetical protein